MNKKVGKKVDKLHRDFAFIRSRKVDKVLRRWIRRWIRWRGRWISRKVDKVDKKVDKVDKKVDKADRDFALMWRGSRVHLLYKVDKEIRRWIRR